MSKIEDLEEKIKNTEWEIKQMKGVFSYFKREAKKATSQEDIEEMGIIVDDIKIQIRILCREREMLELETLRYQLMIK